MEKIKSTTRKMSDFRTQRERKRDELHDRVCSTYLKVSHEAGPECSYYRITRETALRLGLTRQGVDRILTLRGLHTRNPRPKALINPIH